MSHIPGYTDGKELTKSQKKNRKRSEKRKKEALPNLAKQESLSVELNFQKENGNKEENKNENLKVVEPDTSVQQFNAADAHPNTEIHFLNDPQKSSPVEIKTACNVSSVQPVANTLVNNTLSKQDVLNKKTRQDDLHDSNRTPGNFHDQHEIQAHGNLQPNQLRGDQHSSHDQRFRGQSHGRVGGYHPRGATAYHEQPFYQRTVGPTSYSEKDDDLIELSKELVRILRHGKYKYIPINDEGYAKVKDILNDKKFCNLFPKVNYNLISKIVETNNKKRFELKEVDGTMMIKAAQGHTIKYENLSLAPVTDFKEFDAVVHGTYLDSWEIIKMEGLNRMTRTHIHFAIGMPKDSQVISGMRGSSEVIIKLDMEKALKAGLKFFKSSNNVILCEGDKYGRIHPKLFGLVIQRQPYQKLNFDVPPDYDDQPPRNFKMSEDRPPTISQKFHQKESRPAARRVENKMNKRN